MSRQMVSQAESAPLMNKLGRPRCGHAPGPTTPKRYAQFCVPLNLPLSAERTGVCGLPLLRRMGHHFHRPGKIVGVHTRQAVRIGLNICRLSNLSRQPERAAAPLQVRY